MAELPGKNLRRTPTAVPNRRPGSTARNPAVSAPIQIPDSGEEAPVQRAAAPRRSVRPAAPQAMPTSYKIIGIIALVLIVVGIFGYGPFMRHRYTNTLDTAATLAERQQAADALYSGNVNTTFRIFHERLLGPDAMTRDASAYGMSLIAQENSVPGVTATEELTQNLSKLDAAGKCFFAQRLAQVAKAITHGDADRALYVYEAQKITMIAAALIPETKHADAKVRSAAVEALSDVPASGVCKALVAVATNDADADIKAKARKGFAFTALPESAASLLLAVASSEKDLKNDAGAAFKKVRDKAKSDDLLPLVSSPDESVRKEIVSALGKRPADSKAAEGVTRALKDASPEIRKLALKSVQVTGVAGPASQLLPLMSDADESVRIQCAETLGELRDDGSKKVLLEAFAGNPQGDTLKALSKAMGQRTHGKDIPVIGVLIDQMNKHPDGSAGIRDVLVKMTNVQNDKKREIERKAWDAARWNAWWDNISVREKMKEEALTKLKTAGSRGVAASKKDDKNDKKIYAELSKMTNEGFDLLEKCLELNKKDDPEDDMEIMAIQKNYQANKYTFEKYQSIDEYREKK